MNSVVLMGRLTRDPEVRYLQLQGETPFAIARFMLAVDRRKKKQEGAEGEQAADFISCVAFGKMAEVAEKYIKRGTKIALNGRIQTGSYTNKDGQKVYTTEVVVETLEFAEGKNAQGSGNHSYTVSPEPDATAEDGFMNIPDDIGEELPFN